MAPTAITVRQDDGPHAPAPGWLERLRARVSAWRHRTAGTVQPLALPEASSAYRTPAEGSAPIEQELQDEDEDEIGRYYSRAKRKAYQDHRARACGGYCSFCNEEHQAYQCHADCKLCAKGTVEQQKTAEKAAQASTELFKETFPLVLAAQGEVDVFRLHDQCANAIDLLSALELCHRERVKQRLLAEHRDRKAAGATPPPAPQRPPVPPPPLPPKRISG